MIHYTTLSNEYFLKEEELFPAEHLHKHTDGVLVFSQEARNLDK